ncbi:retinal homeobox protein Rx3-like [Anneissia japonica]|uniref:retinal homeobox protein Rx3-like n=1 Tax=Anneissia japonica TaxID=1529436 RepID=UPI0014258ACC|nr:retinal homeobox protein Rx3-like [Anneissia japonica]
MMQILPSSCGTKHTHSIEDILGLAGSNDTSEDQKTLVSKMSEHSKQNLDLADKEKHNNHHRRKDNSDEVEFDSNIHAEYNDSNAGKEKKKKYRRNRTIFSTFQLCELERSFMKSHYLDAYMREELAARLCLPKLRVQLSHKNIPSETDLKQNVESEDDVGRQDPMLVRPQQGLRCMRQAFRALVEDPERGL